MRYACYDIKNERDVRFVGQKSEDELGCCYWRRPIDYARSGDYRCQTHGGLGATEVTTPMSSIGNLSGQGRPTRRTDTLDHKNRGRSSKLPEMRSQEPIVKAVKGNCLHIVYAYKLRGILYYTTSEEFDLTTLTTRVRLWKPARLAVGVIQ